MVTVDGNGRNQRLSTAAYTAVTALRGLIYKKKKRIGVQRLLLGRHELAILMIYGI